MGIVVTRSYVVTDWRKTRCPIDCDKSGHFGPACSHQRWFPINSLVQVRHDEEGVLLAAHCRPKRTAKAREEAEAPPRPRMAVTPGVYRHATKKEWGTAVIMEEALDKRVFQFETGTTRTFRPSHYHLMERIPGAEAPPTEPAPVHNRFAQPCCPDDDPDDRCRHILLSLKAADGTLGVPGPEDDDKTQKRVEREKGLVELSSISHTDSDDHMPKCPNCRETWSVSRVEDNTYTCRSPVCMRKDRRGRTEPWRFTLGEDNARPTAGRHGWVFDGIDGKRLR